MCVFCKIINKEIPSFIVYENDDVICFLDINASSKGHTLVVPKKHYTNIFDIDSNTACKIMEAIKNVTTILKEKLNVTDVNIINNSGLKAGQTVMHIHFHVIPRYDNDGIVISPKQNDPDFNELEKIHKLIKK